MPDSFPSEESSTTARMRPQGVFVLVVHDADANGLGVWDVLNDEYIVRDATTAFEALEWLSSTVLACVVCVVGKTIRGQDFFKLVSRLSPEQAQRLVYISAADDPDIAFLQSSQSHWLPLPVKPEELIQLVRAVSTR